MSKRRHDLGIYPQSLTFPETKVGESSIELTVILTNRGWDELEIFSITAVGDFSVIPPASLVLAPKDYSSLRVTFDPQSAGSLTGGVYIDTGDAAGREFIALSGTSIETIEEEEEDDEEVDILSTPLIIAENIGEGSGNFIQATTEKPLPIGNGRALIALRINETNTQTPVQISFNDNYPLTVKRADGTDVAINELVAGNVVLGYRFDQTFRVIIENQSAAIYGLIYDAAQAVIDADTSANTAVSASGLAKDYRDEAEEARDLAIAAKEAAELASGSTQPVDTQINAAAAKPSPHDDDRFGFVDTESSNVLKRMSWGNIKSVLKTYFDGLYQGKGNYIPNSATTDDAIAGFISRPKNDDIRLVMNMPFDGTINSTATRCVSGSCTATFRINGTALGGQTNNVTTSEQIRNHTSNNDFVAGDDIILSITNNSNSQDMSFSINFTKKLVAN